MKAWTKCNVLLFTIFLSVIGPSIKLGLFYVQDIMALIVYVFCVDLKKSSFSKNTRILYVPFVCVSISFILKSMMGQPFISNDYNEVVRHAVIAIFVSLFTIGYLQLNEAEKGALERRYAKGVFWVIVYVCVLGIYQYLDFTKFESLVGPLYKLEQYGSTKFSTNFVLANSLSRITSVFYTPIVFAGFIVAFLPVVIFNQRILNRRYIVVALILSVVSLLLTNSRAATLTLGAAIVLSMIIHKKLSWPMLLMFSIGVLTISQLVGSLTARNYYRYYELMDFIKSGFSQEFMPLNLILRIDDITSAISKYNFDKYFISGVSASLLEKDIGWSFHMQYVNWLLKFGLWGIFLTVWQFVITLKLYKVCIKNLRAKPLQFSLFIAFLIITVLNLSQIVTFQPRLRELWVVGIAIALLKE